MAASRPKATLPAFTPVPRLRDRSNGWKPEVQQAFIEALAETGSVEAAARRVGRSSNGAYQLRRHPQAKSFRKAWQAALDLGIQRIEDVAMDRALNGVEVPVYAYGKIIGTRRVYNDRLLMFMLRNRAPKRFAADGARGMNAVDKHRLTQMKKEWRKEWDRERLAADRQEEDDTLESLNRRLDLMREREEAMMSPETRRLKEAFDESLQRDNAEPFWWDEELGGAPVASGAEPEDAEWEECELPEEVTRRPTGWQEEKKAEKEAEPRVRRLKDDDWG